MSIWTLPKESVFEELKTSPRGISEEEAALRLKKYGRNEIRELNKTSYILKFTANLFNFFALLLWVGAVLGYIAGMPQLSYAIVAVIVINAAFSFWQEFKAERATAALKKLLPGFAKVIREGVIRQALAFDLVPGDVILLEEGDNISADARLIEEFEMRVNLSTLTGESAPARRTSDPIPAEQLHVIEIPNLVFAGTSVASGTGRAVVFSTGMKSEFGKIARLTQTVKEEISPLQKEMAHVVRFVTIVAFGMGIVFFILGRFIGKLTVLESFLFMIGIIVANVPEGLLPTLSLSLAMAVQRMAKKNALVKKLSSVETLGSANVILTDKTGTLTMNEMTVREVWTQAPERLNLAGILCNNAKLTPEGKMIGDPTEGALLVAARRAGVDIDQAFDQNSRLYLLPFESRRKRMSSINLSESKPVVYTKGAPKEILNICTKIQIGSVVLDLTEDRRNEIIRQNDQWAETGLRVLAVAYRELPAGEKDYTVEKIEQNLIFLGLVGMMDPPRPEVEAALRICEKAGIRVIMITGDYGLTAESIARRIGMIKGQAQIITGFEIDQLSDDDLKKEIDTKAVLFARVNPEHKLRLVSILQSEGKIVAVTGDGVNDAPALKKADIGVAMGLVGTDVARESSEMILMDDNFATIVAAIEEGRGVYSNIKKFSTYVLTSNVPEAFPFIAYILLKIPLPLTVIQILAIDLFTDIVPALGLGAEKPEPGIMLQPPRPRGKRLFDFALLARAYGFLGIIEGLACLAAFYFMYLSHGWWFGQPMASSGSLYLSATTLCLASIVACQIGNVFVCRTEKESLLKVGLFSNHLVLWGILTELVLINLIIYFPPLQTAFGTAPIDFKDWTFLLIFPPTIFLAAELRKLILRKWYNNKGAK